MKTILSILLIFFAVSVQAQKSCCSATAEFASLGKTSGFSASHQEPTNIIDQDLRGEWVEFETPGGGEAGRAYAVSTENPGKDYLFIFHEWWGLNLHIRSEADRLASELPGVNVLAIDLYDGKETTTRESAAALMESAEESRIRNIIRGAINFAGEDAEIATLGWCFGGGWSMQAAIMAGDQAVACVVYYGMPEQSPEKLAQLEAPVLGIFAENDGWINREAVGKYERAMDEAGKKYESVWYDADHAFANPSNSIYDDNAADNANKKAIQFLHQRLVK